MGCTCKTPARDRYVMLVLSRCRTFASFYFFLKPEKKSLRAKVDRLKVVTQNICVILFGYLSVFGLSVLRPASRLHRASISFAALPQMCCAQSCSTGCQIVVSFWTEVQRHCQLSHPGSIPQPREERHNAGRGNKGGGGFAFDCGLPSSSI